MSCHMPQVSTDIPHIAFTHHRIGVHGRNKASGVLDVRQADLVPFGTTSGLSPLELRRCHALACAEYSARAASPELSAEFRGRALRELQELTIEAPQDGEVAAALARISWEVGDLEAAKVAAQRALRSTNLSSGGRVNSLFVAGDVLLLGLARFQTGNQQAGLADVEHAQRISTFRQDIAETLVKLRKATVSRAGLKSQE